MLSFIIMHRQKSDKLILNTLLHRVTLSLYSAVCIHCDNVCRYTSSQSDNVVFIVRHVVTSLSLCSITERQRCLYTLSLCFVTE